MLADYDLTTLRLRNHWNVRFPLLIFPNTEIENLTHGQHAHARESVGVIDESTGNKFAVRDNGNLE